MITTQNMGTSYVLYAEYEHEEDDPIAAALNGTGLALIPARTRHKRLPVVAWQTSHAPPTPFVVHAGRLVPADEVGGFGAFLGVTVHDKMQEAVDILPHVVPLVVRLLEARRGVSETTKKRRGKRVSA